MGGKAPLFSRILNIFAVNIIEGKGKIPILTTFCKMFLSYIKVKILINSWDFFMVFWMRSLPPFD